jgi:hypothetical protein
LQDIIRAYRKKALQLHPDRNKAPDATQQFILLEEAYKYLRNLKEGKIKPQAGNTQQEEFAKWWAREQESTRQRAQERSRMRYEEFLNSDEYKVETAEDHLINVLVALLALFIDIVLPIYLIGTKGPVGTIISVLAVIMTLPITLPVYSQMGMLKESIKQFRPSLFTFFSLNIKSKAFGISYQNVVFLITVNFAIIFKVVIHSLIPIYIIIGLYAITIITGFATCFYLKIYNRTRQYFYSLCIAPLILGLFYTLNFTFSSNRHTETYGYLSKTSPYANYDYKKSSVIKLYNNKYSSYYGLRVFYSYREVSNGNEVTFVFEDGLFGIRVLKDYSIRWDYDRDDYN